MTATGIVRSEISEFLKTDTPEVLSISGKWGVGKTFTWNNSLQQAAASNGGIALDRYAYVSLFGLNSLNDLRYAIFESTVATDQIVEGPNVRSLMKSIHWLEKKGRELTHLANAVPYAKDILASPKSAFLAVRKQLVCIDDLERHGKDLDLKDVLGLVSMLKEQRDCKVVLLLNEEQLPEESSKEFQVQLEKVVDANLRFDPTVEEASTLALSRDTSVYGNLDQFCRTLGIKNIRVMRKIERSAKKLAFILGQSEPEVLKQSLHTAVLFGWIHYQPKDAPNFDFVLQHNSARADSGSDSIKQKSWRALLTSYEFNSIDRLDELIIVGIRDGYFDANAIKREADALGKVIERRRLDSSFEDAWNLYHDSFSANADEVLDKMYAAVKGSFQTISPTNLSGTIKLFKELGRPEQASELLDFYMANHDGDARFYDLENSTFGDDAKDPDVRAAFAKKLLTFADNRDPQQILIDIALKNAWNPEDIAKIKTCTVDDFKRMFKELSGLDLRRVIKAALQFRNLNVGDAALVDMAQRAEQALIEIGGESPINERRIGKYGLRVSKNTP